MAWCVCHFQIDDSVEVVPNNWIISESLCVWPLVTKPSKLSELIKKKEVPKNDWKTISVRILGRYDDYKTAQRKCKTALDRDNLSSLSEAAEYGKGLRGQKRKKIYSDTENTDTDTENECNDEEELSINFPTYNADKSIVSSKSAHKDSTNTAHSNKSNNYQFEENKNNQNSDNKILTEIHTNFQRHASEMKEFRRQVLLHLHGINTRMGELNQHIDSLQQPNFPVDQENQNITNEDSLKCIENLPIKSNLELKEIERSLQDKQIFNDVATELSRMGGNNLKIMVKKVMCRIITAEIERQYSWEGHKGNRIFKDLNLAKLVLKSIRLTMKRSDVHITDNEIINIIKIWLVKAKLKTKKPSLSVQQTNSETNRSTDSEH
ncbi:MATH and LRR domain-containing protein PFE0570w-like [Camponotus floridanus]|uniref:MATH and LRR domain-containing protein PFE0570w-like n=1 Tax=Camponotus floridanus TaxID=104421 RepID=UPI000DC67729|nr:MATH and LRR domain-containing protein PFE0570w-like [Camponotus floridanus]